MLNKLQIRYNTRHARVLVRTVPIPETAMTPPGQPGTGWGATIETLLCGDDGDPLVGARPLAGSNLHMETLHVLVAALQAGRKVHVVKDGDTTYVDLGDFNCPQLSTDKVDEVTCRPAGK